MGNVGFHILFWKIVHVSIEHGREKLIAKEKEERFQALEVAYL